MTEPFDAISNHDVDTIRALLEQGLDPNGKDGQGLTFLERALRAQAYNVACVLFQHGADPSTMVQKSADVFFCVNQREMQTYLLSFTTEALRDFASQHTSETFYAFAFEWRYDYGNVTLSMNTVEDLKETRNDYQKTTAHIHSSDEGIYSLKWNPGDWKYQGFKWVTIIPKFDEAEFLDALNVTLKRLDANDAFKMFQETVDFGGGVYEYD